MNDKNLRYYEQGLAQKFGDEFVSKLEKLLDESNISDGILVEGIYDYVQESCDREDCHTWLIDQGLYSLADNKEFRKALCHRYRSDYDSEYGTWDNISSAYYSIKDDDEWKEITAEAERLRDEEDGDYNDEEEDD